MNKVLLIDDEPGIRVTLQMYLSASGYAVEVAGDASGALQLLDAGDFGVVVSDINLPGLSGLKLLRVIMATAPTAQVIMMTGEPTADSAAEALRMGALDYLTKPVGKNAILRTVGNAFRLIGLANDKRRLEEENATYRKSLETLVEARTEELRKTLDALQRAQHEIIRHERLNALAQLAAGICHDFNNALMPIRGLTNFLVSHPETLDDRAETLRLLGSIHTAADDAKEIVRRLREFYRPRDVLEMASVAVDKLLRDVVELTRPKWETQAQGEGRAFRVTCDATAVTQITGNASQLRELLTNLVLNAVDAMPQGGTIALSAKQAEDGVVICVADTGVGMPQAILDRCLEPFFSTKGEHGTGMGLAMVHGVVTRHKGTLTIESTPSKGTTFRVWLPPAVLEGRPQLPVEQTPRAESGPLRVLVIDDEGWSRTLIAKYLHAAGHTVVCADGGADGIAKAAHADFDIVITDGAMPGQNGDQVALAVKRTAPGVPVLLMTGDIATTGKDASLLFDGVLEKPVTQREVLQAIEGLTAGRARGIPSELVVA